MTPATARPPGRPRVGIDAAVFAATLATVHELGYAGATMDRVAAAAGVAKTTLYRRWESKGVLIVDCLLDALGPVPLEGSDRVELLSSAIRWTAARIAEPGVAGAFAGVFVDAVSDPALRQVLATRFQAPYLTALRSVLDEPDDRILLLVDVVVGTLLHRAGITGAPMVDADVDALTAMVLHQFAAPGGTAAR
ncbi:TetR/AcrR family transcriptional regulator [Umezawaea sp. NPDC059074]|uniref:TetR/AcrR family transcriptional regulator n=1 Tax=Umezawaea sp. NPDC059074 TaxID=3346716 RepID=UPI0036B34485